MQGRLRDEALSFEIETECACCDLPIRFSMSSDLGYELAESESNPLFFIPMVDFTKLKAPSIIDHF